ncbi:NUDIX domain-containing protein [Candidatus Acetothermia bacterium]|nr:NUDIX domain-containing protein [Candidatus Acetothermia bacterium]
MSFADSYLGKLRKLIGHRLVLLPGNRAILENFEGKILLLKRTDFGLGSLPSGSPEEGESAEASIIREVLEETGLTIKKMEPIGYASAPEHETITFPNGDKIQNFCIVWHVTEWEGMLQAQNEEAAELKFFDPTQLPSMLPNHQRSIEKFLKYKRTGKFQLH